MNITLVGFMGTGKTAVAKRLAGKLDMKYVDLDQLIEEQEGRKISDIFANDGEAYFRKVEKEITGRVSQLDGAVIATGGGVVLDDQNINDLKRKGILICLLAEPQIIMERTKKYIHRPLLNVADPQAGIRALLNKRASCYAKADYSIDTSYLTVEEVIEKVIEIIGKEKRCLNREK